MIGPRLAFFWLLVLLTAILLWQIMRSSHPAQADPEISYSEFLIRVTNGEVSKVVIAGSVVQGTDAKGESFRSIAPPNQSAMLQSLQAHNVEVRFKDTSDKGWPSLLLNLFPIIVLVFLWFYIVREKQKRRLAQRGPTNSAPPPEPNPRFGP